MMRENLIRQHREIIGLINQIENMLGKDSDFEILIRLGELAGKVKTHLVQEDRVLYPALSNHRETGIRETAQRFVREMGGLAEEFEQFRARYASVRALRGDPGQFTADLKRIDGALNKRILAEVQELCPLVGA